MENIEKVKVTIEQQGEQPDVIEANFVLVAAVISEDEGESHIRFQSGGTVSGFGQEFLLERHIAHYVGVFLEAGITEDFILQDLANIIASAVERAIQKQSQKTEAH